MRILRVLIIAVVFTVFISNVWSLGILVFTDAKITKAYFTPYYYASITSKEYDMTVFIVYMKQNGWEKWERIGGLVRFYKEDQTFEILNTQVKTVIIDGKPSFLYK